MWLYNILTAVVAIIVIIAVLYLLFRLFVLKQGDEHIVLLPKRKTNFQLLDMTFDSITLFCDIPFVNKGASERYYNGFIPSSSLAGGTV
nr:hypothetical protein [Veillonella denticariosi]